MSKIVKASHILDNDGNEWSIKLHPAAPYPNRVYFHNEANDWEEDGIDVSLLEALLEHAKEIQFIIRAMSIKEE